MTLILARKARHERLVWLPARDIIWVATYHHEWPNAHGAPNAVSNTVNTNAKYSLVHLAIRQR